MFGNGSASVEVIDGLLSLGIPNDEERTAPIQLRIGGDLRLYDNAILHIGLGQFSDIEGESGEGDIILVDGDLYLAGALQVSSIGGFGNGIYTIFQLGADSEVFGDFSDFLLPGGVGASLDRSRLSEGLLLLSVGGSLGPQVHWSGDAGAWNATNMLWTDASGAPREAWGNGFAIFTTDVGGGIDAGTISVEGDIALTGMQFKQNGFVIDGSGALVMTESQTAFNVDNGVIAEISARISEENEAVLYKQGPGTLVLTGSGSNWTGGTTIEAGTLQIGNAETRNGQLPGNVEGNPNTRLAFAPALTAGEQSWAGVFSGSNAQLHHVGGGVTKLTGNHLYTGLTHVAKGTLQVGDGGASGWLGIGAITIDENATLAFSRSDDRVLNNTITGSGTLVQRGATPTSALTLSGNLSQFHGQAYAESGLLNINSTSFRGDVIIGDGGRLGGTGTIGHSSRLATVTIGDGGVLAPGNSIGTLTIIGNVTFDSGARYEVELNTAGENDYLRVQGVATLNGQVAAFADGAEADWRPRTQYIILSAERLIGEFGDGAVEENYTFLDASLSYDHTMGLVYLYVDRNDISFGDVATTPNHYQLASAIQGVVPSHPVFESLYDAMETLTDDVVHRAYSHLSGEAHASVRNLLIDDSRLLRDAVLANAGSAVEDGQTRVWMRALHHDGERGGGDLADFDRRTSGFLLGADYAINDRSSMGWGTGIYRSDAEAGELASEGDVNSAHIAIYGATRIDGPFAKLAEGGLGLRLGAGYSWHEIDVRRVVDFPGYLERMRSEYDANTTQVFAEADIAVRVGEGNLAPFVGLAWVRLSTDAFIEGDYTTDVGGGTAVLRADSASDSATFATLGARGAVPVGDMVLQGMLGYRRALSGEDPETRLSFLNGSPTYGVRGAPIGRDVFVADLGLDWAWGNSTRIGIAYAGQIGSDVTDHALRANLHITLP